MSRFDKIILIVTLPFVFFNPACAGKTERVSASDKADGFYYLQKWDSAAIYYGLLQKMELHEKNHPGYVSALANQGICYFYLNDMTKATACLKKAVGFSKTNNAGRDFHFSIYRLQAMLLQNKHDYQEAAKCYEKAFSTYQETVVTDKAEILLNIMISQCYCYNMMNDWENALFTLKRAEKFLPSGQNEHSYFLYYYYGNCFNKTGDFDKSTLFYQKTLELANNLSKSKDNINSLLCAIGFNYAEKGDYKTAVNYCLEGLQTVAENSIAYATTARSVALFYEKTNDDKNALFFYKKAVNFWEHSRQGQTYEKIQTYLDYGNFCLKINKGAEALQKLNHVLKICKDTYGKKHYLISKTLNSLGNYYAEQGSHETALKFYQKALQANSPDFSSGDIFTNPDNREVFSEIYQITILKQKAASLKKLHDQTEDNKYLIAASNTYDCMVSCISKIKDHISGTEDKLTFARNTKEAINNAIEVNAELFCIKGSDEWFDRAFRLAETGKASVLLSEIKDNQAKQAGNIPASFLMNESRLEKNIIAYEKMLFDESIKKNRDKETIGFYESRLFDLKRDHDTITKYFEMNFPEYHRLKYRDIFESTRQLQNKLVPDQAMLEYCITGSMIYIFAINKFSRTLTGIKKSPGFEKSVSVYRDEFSREKAFGSGTGEFQVFTGAAYNLYQNLIFPVKEIIKGKRLIIIPDETTGAIPFESFLTERAGPGDNFKTLSYLIYKYPVSYRYLGYFLNDETRKHEIAGNSIVAFAPDYEAIGTTANNVRGTDINMGALDWTIKEVEQICRTFGGDFFTGKEATKTSFLNTMKEHDIFHFAMHSVIDLKNPMYSGLIFSGTGKDNDNFLSALELYGMKFNASLAVLSACNTGSGQLAKGEGIMSLARAFYFAGVKSIVMTLWSVEDKNSADLMQSFYSYLGSGNPKDIALQKAKTTFLQATDELQSHPYFWAGYVNIGNTRPLYLQKRTDGIFLLISGILLASGLVCFRIFRKKSFYFIKDFVCSRFVRSFS